MHLRSSVARVVAASLLFASTASAAITATWVPVASGDGSVGAAYPANALTSDPTLNTMQTWDLLVDFTTSDWTLAGLRGVLGSGAFYKNAVGGNTRPSDALITAIPAVGFTSFVTSPGSSGTADPTNVLGGFPEGQPQSLGDATSAIPGTFSVSWGDLVVTNPGEYRIARWTFPLGQTPDVLTEAPSASFTRTVDEVALIPEIPEPATLGMLAMAGILGLRRRA